MTLSDFLSPSEVAETAVRKRAKALEAIKELETEAAALEAQHFDLSTALLDCDQKISNVKTRLADARVDLRNAARLIAEAEGGVHFKQPVREAAE